jgi:hypothetical protein
VPFPVPVSFQYVITPSFQSTFSIPCTTSINTTSVGVPTVCSRSVLEKLKIQLYR